VQLDSTLETSRSRCVDRQGERKDILTVLEKYVETEQLHDVEGQVRWFRFPYRFGRENRAFETVNEQEFREVLTGKAKRFHDRYGTRNAVITLFNRSVKFFGKTFGVASFDWEYAFPDGETRYGLGNTLFLKQDSTWKIVM